MAKTTARSDDTSLWFKINEDKGGRGRPLQAAQGQALEAG